MMINALWVSEEVFTCNAWLGLLEFVDWE